MKVRQPIRGVVSKMPELPKCINGKVGLDGYFQRFERFATISDNNIGQWLRFPPYPLPNVVLQVQKNIERKVDIIVATLKEGKRGRAFF